MKNIVARPAALRRLALSLGAAALVCAALSLTLPNRAHSAGGPVAVQIANGPLPVSEVSSAAHTPVTLATTVSVPSGQYIASRVLYTVPSGKRLVIQSLNALSEMDVVQNGVQDITLSTVGTGQPFTYSYPATAVGSYDWVTAGTTLVYADSDTQIKVGAPLLQRANAAGVSSNIALVGYLEDAPEATRSFGDTP